MSTVDVKAALRHLRRVEPRFAPLVRVHGAPEFRRTRNSFESLGRAIVYQQLSGAAAGTIYGRLVALFPRGRFPTPAVLRTMTVPALRAVGLSRAKASYLIDLAEKFDDGVVSPRRFLRLDDEAMARELTQVKGIGPWSVHMFQIFALGRPDVLPVGDLGVQKGMQKFFRTRALPKPARMQALAAPWQPYRSVGSWYMWRLLDTAT